VAVIVVVLAGTIWLSLRATARMEAASEVDEVHPPTTPEAGRPDEG